MSWTGVHITKTTAINTFVGSLRQAKDQKAWKLDKHHSSAGGPSKKPRKFMTFTLLLCVLLMQDRRHPFPELPRLIKLHLTKFTFKKKCPNLPPFPLLLINTFQSLKFIASHLPSCKRKKKKCSNIL